MATQVKQSATAINPLDALCQLSTANRLPMDSLAFAEYLDQVDQLRLERSRFIFPKKKNVPNCKLIRANHCNNK